MQMTKVGLAVCIVLVIVLTISNVWFYTVPKDEIQILHDEKNGFQSQVHAYESILNLQEEESVLLPQPLSQASGAKTLVVSFDCPYAGYLNVSVFSSTSNCYVTVEYWFENHLLSSTKTLGTEGVEYFSVLPTESISVYIGNTNWFSDATHIISVDYAY